MKYIICICQLICFLNHLTSPAPVTTNQDDEKKTDDIEENSELEDNTEIIEDEVSGSEHNNDETKRLTYNSCVLPMWLH